MPGGIQLLLASWRQVQAIPDALGRVERPVCAMLEVAVRETRFDSSLK